MHRICTIRARNMPCPFIVDRAVFCDNEGVKEAMTMFNNPYAPPGFGGYRPQMPYSPQAVMPPQPAGQAPAPVQQSTVTMVTSRAQAEVAQVPFDGQSYFFFDTSSRRLYCKSFDPQTGLCPLLEYAPVMQEQPPQYATVEQLTALEQRITAMLTPAEEGQRRPRTTRKEAEAE